MTSNYLKLSLPKSISSTNNDNDTFSKDLLRQFDKKRSRLHFELGFASQEPSPESSRIMTPNSNNLDGEEEEETSEYYNQEPIQLDDEQEDEPIITRTRERYISSQHSNISSKRSSSTASELFRKSSAFLKSKFTTTNKKSIQTTTAEEVPPKKLMMKTTISIPSITNTTKSFPILSTPTITQYPPKPLVYSPIEPIPLNNNNNNNNNQIEQQKPLLHRISMPLLRVYNDTTTNLSRHTSFGRRRKSEPDNNTKKKLKRSKK